MNITPSTQSFNACLKPSETQIGFLEYLRDHSVDESHLVRDCKRFARSSFEICKRFKTAKHAVSHVVRAKIVCGYADQMLPSFRYSLASHLPSDFYCWDVALASKRRQFGAVVGDLLVCPFKKSSNSIRSANLGLQVSSRNEVCRMSILPTHYINRHKQSGDRAHSLNPARPSCFIESKLIAKKSNIDSPENCQEKNRQVGVLHRLSKFHGIGILA